MGFNISWIAATDISAEELAGQLGLDIGEEVDYPSTAGITTVGEWTLVYSNGDFLLSDDELAELSKGREITTHQSVDTVMYATTAEYADGALSRRAEVDLDKADDEDVVSTLGFSDNQHKKLKRLNRKSGPSAYDEIAEIARRRVGFRHDRPGPKFRELVDNRPKPASASDQLIDWLLSEGFEERGEGYFRRYTRAVSDDFFLSINVNEKQRDSNWPSASVGVGHLPTQAKLNILQGSSGKTAASAAVAIVRDTYTRADQSPRRLAEQSVDRYRFMIDHYSSLIDRAVEHCSIDGIASVADPVAAIAIELSRGWSNRGESLLRQLELLEFNFVMRERFELMVATEPTVRQEPQLRSDAGSKTLRDRMSLGEKLTGVELATLQAAATGEDGLCAQLQFGHWSLALNDQRLDEDVALHIIDEHITWQDLRFMAKILPLTARIEQALVDHSDVNLQWDVAQHPGLSEAAQIKLAGAGDCHTVGSNPSLTIEAQHLLVENSETPYVLKSLAGNPSLDPELQPILAKSKTFEVRRELAGNTAVTDEILVKLSKDRKGDVKTAALTNPHLPKNLQIEVAGGSGKNSALGMNKNLCAEAQRLLLERGELYHLARNPSLVDEFMDILAANDDKRIRSGLAKNKNLPPRLHKQLAADSAEGVRSTIAARPDLEETIRARLQKDDSDLVRRSAHRLRPEKLLNGQFIQEAL